MSRLLENPLVANPVRPKIRTKSLARKWIAFAHLWLGLPIGLLLSFFALSGSAIVFRAEIERALEPAKTSTSPCRDSPDLNAAIQAGTAAVPGSRITQILLPLKSGQNFQLTARNSDGTQTRVIYNGCEVLGTLNLAWLDWLVDFHHNLLAGKSGRRAVGVIGIVLIALVLSGLIVWLLSKPNLRKAFTVRFSGPPRLVMLELHRAFGLGAMAFLTLSAITGICLSYPDTVRQTVDVFTNTHAERPEKLRLPKLERVQFRPLEDYRKAVSTSIPGGEIREIRLPEPANGTLQLRVWAPGDYRHSGNNRIILNAADLLVRSTTRFATAAPSIKVAQGVAALHYAEWGGLGVQFFWLAAGLTPGVLFISGTLIWWFRRKPSGAKS